MVSCHAWGRVMRDLPFVMRFFQRMYPKSAMRARDGCDSLIDSLCGEMSSLRAAEIQPKHPCRRPRMAINSRFRSSNTRESIAHPLPRCGALCVFFCEAIVALLARSLCPSPLPRGGESSHARCVGNNIFRAFPLHISCVMFPNPPFFVFSSLSRVKSACPLLSFRSWVGSVLPARS